MVMVFGLGGVIFLELIPLLGGLLGAVTLYILLRGQMRYLTIRRHWRRGVAALMLNVEAVMVFLVPLSLVVWLLVDRLQDLTLNPRQITQYLDYTAEYVRSKTGFDLWRAGNVSSLIGYFTGLGQWLVQNVFSFGVNIFILPFVLYFMLIGGRRMEHYLSALMPFSRADKRDIMAEVVLIVRSNAIVIPLLALTQGVAAYLGYLIFGVREPLFWGVVTCFATILPVVGAALVWFPLAVFLMLEQRWGMGVGLMLYGGLFVTQIDNVMRMVMQKKMADTHPLITILGVIVGLPLFGFLGLIFGPLMLALFTLCLDLFKRGYIDPPFSDSSL